MPGKRPPPRGAPKGKPEPKSKSGQKAAPKGAPKPKSSTGIPQAAIDASNAARRAGLGGVARKGASEVMSPRKGDAPAAQRCHSSGPPTTGPTRATSATRLGVRSRGGATKGPAGPSTATPTARRRWRTCRPTSSATSKMPGERPAGRSCSSASRMLGARATGATASARHGGSWSTWSATLLCRRVCESSTA